MSRHRRVARRVSGFVLDYLLALPIGCAIALVWANTFPESYFRVTAPAADSGLRRRRRSLEDNRRRQSNLVSYCKHRPRQ